MNKLLKSFMYKLFCVSPKSLHNQLKIMLTHNGRAWIDNSITSWRLVFGNRKTRRQFWIGRSVSLGGTRQICPLIKVIRYITLRTNFEIESICIQLEETSHNEWGIVDGFTTHCMAKHFFHVKTNKWFRNLHYEKWTQ